MRPPLPLPRAPPGRSVNFATAGFLPEKLRQATTSTGTLRAPRADGRAAPSRLPRRAAAAARLGDGGAPARREVRDAIASAHEDRRRERQDTRWPHRSSRSFKARARADPHGALDEAEPDRLGLGQRGGRARRRRGPRRSGRRLLLDRHRSIDRSQQGRRAGRRTLRDAETASGARDGTTPTCSRCRSGRPRRPPRGDPRRLVRGRAERRPRGPGQHRPRRRHRERATENAAENAAENAGERAADGR